jgi:hypothetical protein
VASPHRACTTEDGVIHITKSVDAETHKVKSTKTGTTRRVPIEPHVRPLLQRLHDERTSKSGDRVLWLPDHEDRAVLLREHLKVAGVERAELFANDVGSKHITFHDLRGRRFAGTIRSASSSALATRPSRRPRATSARPRTCEMGSAPSFHPCRPTCWPHDTGRFWLGFWPKPEPNSQTSQICGVPSGATGDRTLRKC